MATTSRSSFGTLLQCFRRSAELTQRELAARAGYSTIYIGLLERGLRRPPPDTVTLLAAALGLDAPERELLRAALDEGERPAARLQAPPLVGRLHEQAVLERHLAGVGPPILLLAGEPGIGKSRLLQEAARRGGATGWRVLQGGSSGQGSHDPYAPLPATLDRYLRTRTPAQRAQDLQGCAWLQRLLPELAAADLAPLPTQPLPPDQERRLLTAALAGFLANVAGPGGTLLVLDDLHWASPDALALLRALLRADLACPLRLVGAYRDSEVPAPAALLALLGELAQAGLATQLTLGPLAPGEATQLCDHLAGGKPAALRARLVERAEGVPFFLVSWTQALQTGTLTSSDSAAAPGDVVPWDITQGVRGRVAALPAAAQEVLEVAALAGRAVSRTLLLRAAGRSRAEAEAALAAACRARLLEEDARGWYVFTHDVIREVVEGDLGAGRRTALHRRLARALERERGAAPVEALAYHYRQAGDLDRAARYLEQAGDRARAQGAQAAAAQAYREAVAQLDELGRALEAARLREKLGALLTVVGQYDAALTVLEEVAGVYQAAGELEGLGRAVAEIAQAHACRGTPEVGIRRLEPLLGRGLPDAGSPPASLPLPPRALAALYTALAYLCLKTGRYGRQLAAATEAMRLARAASDDGLLLQAAYRRAAALMGLGRTAEALPALEEAARLADALDDRAQLCSASLTISSIYINAGELGRAAPYAEQAHAVAARLGDPARLLRTLCNRGVIALFTGDWSRARADFEEARTIGRRIGASAESPYPAHYLGFLRLFEGAWDEAARLFAESQGLAEPIGDLQVLRWSQAATAWCALLQGQPARAHARLAPLLDRPDLDPREIGVDWLLVFLAWAQLELGDAAAAGATITRAITSARAGENRLCLVEALRVQALVAIQEQRWSVAAQALEEGLALARAMPYPYAEGTLLHAQGLLRVAQGAHSLASESLHAALALFRRVGARTEIERTGATLASIGQDRAERSGVRISDTQWAQIQQVLPPAPRGRGRPRVDDRRALEAILYVQRAGGRWSDLPPELGDDATAHRRFQQWRASGAWDRISAVLSSSDRV